MRMVIKGRKQLLAWLAMLALGLRALIPAGYMPDFSGQSLLVICDGAASYETFTAHAGHHHHDKHAQHSRLHSVCPFSVGVFYTSADAVATYGSKITYGVVEPFVLHSVAPVRRSLMAHASPRSPPVA